MIDKINEISGISPVGGVKAKRNALFDESRESQDGFAVSSFAREMANISSELAKIPEVREDKIRDLRRQIEEGTYKPDLNALASNLIWAGINRINEE